MLRKSWLGGLLLLAGALAAACTTTGVGTGTTRGSGSPVDFTWTSSGAVDGAMTATLPSTGQTFSGRFFQVTSETRTDDLQPLWIGWQRSPAWPYWGSAWGAGWGPRFMTHYSGRVLANLSTTTGEHMRCSFQLVHPSRGMSGGGLGRCQVPDGKTIDATFPAA